MNTDHEGIVMRYWNTTWIDREFESLRQILTDPVLRHTPNGSEQRSVEDLAADLARATRSVRSSGVLLESFASNEGDSFCRIRPKGVSLTTGNPLDVSFLCEYRFEHDRISEVWQLHQTSPAWQTFV